MSDKSDKRVMLAGALILTLVGGVFAVYWPALPGPFIFDDWHNLIPLGRYNELDLLQRLLIYITHEGESFIQRPLSFLSFYINDNIWPGNPESFRFTNIAIHAINTLLVFWLSCRIVTLLAYKEVSEKNALFLAFAVALLWGLHPIQVNAVAYIVQRMTLLSGLFTLSGLVLYSCGREQLAANNERKGLRLMSLSILIFMPLAFLSKETGVLLPLYIFVLEFTLFRTLSGHKSAIRWSIFFVAIPTTAALVGIIVVAKGNFFQTYDALTFDPVERLLTQSRILWDYVRNILVPMARTSSLFHDNYPVSSSLLEPLTTLYSVTGGLIFFITAVIFRSRWPIISFAVFWFLAGHLLESTVIGLELYFEHRNYMPSFAVLFACVVGIDHALQNKPKTLMFLMIAYAGLLIFVTHINTSKWNSEFELEMSWYRDNPTSIRSGKGIFGILVTVGQYDQAREIVVAQQKRWPKNAEMPLFILLLDCYSDKPNDSGVSTFMNKLAVDYSHSNTLHKTIEHLHKKINNNTCPSLKLKDLELVVERLLEHPQIVNGNTSEKWAFVARELYYHLQLIARKEGDNNKAILAFEKGNNFFPTRRLMMDQMEWLISEGHNVEALGVAHKLIAILKERKINDYLNPRHKKLTEYVIQLQQVAVKKKIKKE